LDAKKWESFSLVAKLFFFIRVQNFMAPSLYRGFLPNATFGPGEKLHWPNFALAKYLAIYFIPYANFGLFISLVPFLAIFRPEIRTNEINNPKLA
jgi:hypothetical protein